MRRDFENHEEYLLRLVEEIHTLIDSNMKTTGRLLDILVTDDDVKEIRDKDNVFVDGCKSCIKPRLQKRLRG